MVQYPGFKKNQILRPDREAKSKFPGPPNSPDEKPGEPGMLSRNPGLLQECSGSTLLQIKLQEVKLRKDIKRNSLDISPKIPSLVEKIFPSPKDKELFHLAREAISSTRKAGKVSDSIILAQLKAWKQYPPGQVHGGIKIYLSKECHQEGKGEKYLLGIIRNQPEPEKNREFRSTGSPMVDAYYREQELSEDRE